MPKTLTTADATRLVVETLMAQRTSAANAEAVAHALVAAELDGLASHGLSRLPAYADQARSGKVDGFAVPTVNVRSPAAATVDAKDGFAFAALALAIETAATGAKAGGVSAVAVSASHHCGVAGHHVEALAERGLVALLFANTPGAMAPWGGRTATFGTNPIAFAAPRASAPSLVIDLSLSKVARGKIMVAKQKGTAIPEGWALDKDGQATTDAGAALAGTMVPLGDAKGAALALMVEILAATLTGSNHAFEATSFFDGTGAPPRVGQLLIALDPAAFGSGDFAARLEVLLSHILGQPGTRLPGDRRIAERAARAAAGIAVDEALLADIERRRTSV